MSIHPQSAAVFGGTVGRGPIACVHSNRFEDRHQRSPYFILHVDLQIYSSSSLPCVVATCTYGIGCLDGCPSCPKQQEDQDPPLAVWRCKVSESLSY